MSGNNHVVTTINNSCSLKNKSEPDDDTIKPAWLNESYLENVLRQYEKDDEIKVIGFSSRSAVPKGGNYVGLLLRVQVNYVHIQQQGDDVKKTKSLVVKTALLSEETAKVLEEFGVLEKEMLMYTNVLPLYTNLLAANGDTDQLFPATIFTDSKTQTIIMEDLKDRGYQTADRHKGLDVNHMKIAISKLSKLHACSMVLEQEKRINLKNFQRGQIGKSGGVWNDWYTSMMNAMVDEIKTWEGYEVYVKKLERLRSTFIEQAADMFDDIDTFPKVLIHGDYWINNMMFRYDENGNPVDSVVVSQFLLSLGEIFRCLM